MLQQILDFEDVIKYSMLIKAQRVRACASFLFYNKWSKLLAYQTPRNNDVKQAENCLAGISIFSPHLPPPPQGVICGGYGC